MDVRAHNREAWNREVGHGNRWTVPVSSEVIAAARKGDWHIVLTEDRPVPKNWFPPLEGCETLCLASGGGQQGPILAAAGARVTVFDNSPRQLEQDRRVAERDGLEIETVEGDMRDLSAFPDERFDLIVHPISNVFIHEVHPVWKEAFRVLKPGGVMLAAFMNPAVYLFDFQKVEQGIFEVKYSLPYSDVTDASPEHRQRLMEEGWCLEFSHSLEDQIAGQTDAGFVITGLYEDRNGTEPIGKLMPSYIATRSLKPRNPLSAL